MKRLLEGPGKNSPAEYDRIFSERALKGKDPGDIRRWKRLIRRFRGGILLDIGCLDSLIFFFLKKHFSDKRFAYVGIDVAAKAIAEMSRRYQAEPRARFEVRDAYAMEFPDAIFDYVVVGEVLEHLEGPKRAVAEAFRVLRSGGWLAASVPLNEAIEPGAVDRERHLWSFTAGDMLELMRPYGTVKIERLGSRHFPTYQYCFPTLLAFCRKK